MTETAQTTIPGYAYGAPSLERSPVTMEELDLLKQTVLFTDDDADALRLAGEVLADQADAVLDVWYGFVASHPHLVTYFSGPDGAPLADYLGRVRARFKQWIFDTCAANYDQAWLDYQHEIGLRHHRTKKNQTDGVESTPLIHFRYLPAFIYPVSYTLKPFLAAKGHDAETVDRMYQAWQKAVILQVILWSYPYVKEGDF